MVIFLKSGTERSTGQILNTFSVASFLEWQICKVYWDF